MGQKSMSIYHESRPYTSRLWYTTPNYHNPNCFNLASYTTHLFPVFQDGQTINQQYQESQIQLHPSRQSQPYQLHIKNVKGGSTTISTESHNTSYTTYVKESMFQRVLD